MNNEKVLCLKTEASERMVSKKELGKTEINEIVICEGRESSQQTRSGRESYNSAEATRLVNSADKPLSS